VFKKLSVAQKLGGGFGILTVLVGVLGILAWLSIDGFTRQEEALGTLVEATMLADRADREVVDFQRLLFNHVSEEDSAQMASIEEEIDATEKDVKDALTKLRELEIPPNVVEKIDSVEAKLGAFFSPAAQVLDLSRANKSPEALVVIHAEQTQAMIELQAELGAILALNRDGYQHMLAADKAQAALVTAVLLGMVVVSLALSLVLGFVLIRTIRRPLAQAVGLAGAIIQGDLTYKVDPKALEAQDEFGKLMRALNHMQEDLAHSVSQIETSAGTLEQIGGQLGQAIEDTVEAVGSIGQNVEEVNGKVQNQAASVTETSATINQIVKSIEGLQVDIDNQASAVTQSSASIEQMMSNIQSVTKNVEQMGDEFTKLVGASDDGKAKLLTVADKVRLVSAQSRKLLEANGVIKGIAAQTNLLAMNAAIEAAHAGEAGRGFAVVADEIRKLAEMAAKQSGEISKDIASILKEITTVVSATGDSEKAFGTILAEIAVLNRYEQEVKQAMLEQSEGSRQILEAIAQINEITTHVKDSATEITEGSRSIRTEMQNLAAVSEELNVSMHQIDDGTKRIRTSTIVLEQVGQRNAEQVTALAGVVTKFKL